MPSPLLDHWLLDPEVVFLNHGSFGACPKVVLAAQSRFRERMEREPVRFFIDDLEPMVDAVRDELAAFLGADAAGLVFVNNATSGVNAVVRSMDLRAGDEVLVTNHAYNACRNAFAFVAERSGANVVVADLPFPVASEDEVLEAILAKAGPKTRLALIDHVTSPTGLVLPLERIVKELGARGVDTLVDGAHAPGMLPLRLRDIGAAYYTGNLHKWVCAPKGTAFLHVREDKRASVRPTVISHGANSHREGRSKLWIEFDWVGTQDPSGILALPEALKFLPSLAGGTWDAVYARNRAVALAARARLCQAFSVPEPAPATMIGSLAAVPLPGHAAAPSSAFDVDPLQKALAERFHIQVPIMPWRGSQRLVRISAQLYNDPADYERLIDALRTLLGEA